VGRPNVVVVEDPRELGRAGAEWVARRVAGTPEASVVVPTGETPLNLYRELATLRDQGRFDPSMITVCQLDEYLGIGLDDRRRLFGWMQRTFLEPLRIADERVVRLPVSGDLDVACAAYDRELEGRGGVGIAILGIGANGHLGFNEPPSDRSAPTRRVQLSRSSVEANARYWGSPDDVPRSAVTIGMAPLLAARSILLLASGAGKQTIVTRAMQGPIVPDVPASYLQEADDVTVLVDRAAWPEGDRT